MWPHLNYGLPHITSGIYFWYQRVNLQKHLPDYVKVCIENGLKFEATAGSSNMTMLHFNEHCQAVYSNRLLMLEWNTPFTHQIGLPMTSGFPPLKCTLKGWRFEGIKGLHKNVTAVLKVNPKGEFHKSFWHHYAKCAAAQGNYFEDEGNLVTPFLKPYV
jgi:hypothetical protein